MSLELDYPIWLLCEVAGVSRSAYYKYKNKPLKTSTELVEKIIDIYNKSGKRAGYRTIKSILKDKYNLTVNHKKVLLIMQENGIQSIVRKKFRTSKYNLEGSIIHSDQGVHYTSKAYVDLLKELKVNQSMSRKGNCWDNAKAESFFSHYKCETIYIMGKRIKDLKDVCNITEEYMDYYINQRPQKALRGMSPRAYKDNYLKLQKI